MVQKDGTEAEVELERDVVEEADMKSTEVVEVAELSLNSVVGISTPGTIKLRGQIKNEAVVVVVDCGATHNSISLKLVEKLNIPRSELPTTVS